MNSPASTTAAQESTNLRFFSPRGAISVRRELDAVLKAGTRSLRGAVCFFTGAGYQLLKQHARRLLQDDSFFIASVDFPTNLKALERLHRVADGHVYIHLGGVTPEEKGVGRSLMHSKILLAEGDAGWNLWVGSHNMTAMAIEGGNFEAASLLSVPAMSQAVQDAIEHLETCRNTAEVFDPQSMDRYKDIQRRRAQPFWDSERNVLVVHAEATEWPGEETFVARIQIVPTELDRLVRNDRPIRLFLHKPGALARGKMVDYSQAQLFVGEITAVVRTEAHPTIRGAHGEFPSANYDIDVASLVSIPVLIPGGNSNVRPCTQAVIRIGQKGKTGDEVYSIRGRSPFVNALDSAGEQDLHEVDREMARFFTADSLKRGTLVYRPVTGVRQDLIVRGYDETVRSRFPADLIQSQFGQDEVFVKGTDDDPVKDRKIKYLVERPKRPIDPYFFLSSYVIRPR